MQRAARCRTRSLNVLVLNRSYQAIQTVELRRAFGLLCVDRAEVIHCEDGCFTGFGFDAWRRRSAGHEGPRHGEEDWIRAVSFEIQAPRVIRLLGFDRVPSREVSLSRQAVFARDGHACQYCGRKLPRAELSLDHVVPRCRGGRSTWDNLVCACLRCNARKGDRTPSEARMRLRTKPAQPKRSPALLQKLTNPKYASWLVWLEPWLT